MSPGCSCAPVCFPVCLQGTSPWEMPQGVLGAASRHPVPASLGIELAVVQAACFLNHRCPQSVILTRKLSGANRDRASKAPVLNLV